MTRYVVAFLKRARKISPLILALAFLLVFTSALYGFYEEGVRVCKPVEWHESVYYAIGIFTMAGNRFDYPQSTILHVDYLLAPLIAASAIFGAFLKVIEERAPLLFRRFSRHTVVGGLGKLGMILVRHEQRRRRAFIAIEIEERSREVSDAKELDQGAVLLGDMTSAALLARARVHLARRVFFTASSDVANLDAAFHVRNLARKHKVKQPPAVFVHVFDERLAASLARHLDPRDPTDTRITPFNGYRFAAKALFAKLVRDGHVRSMRVTGGLSLTRTAWPAGAALSEPIEKRAELAEDRRRLFAAFEVSADGDGGESDRFAILGLGRLGSVLVDDLLRHAGKGARFLLVDRSKETLQATLDRVPDEVRSRFEIHAGDAMVERAAIERVGAFAPSAAIVCTDNDLGNLRLSLDLHARGIRTVTRMFDLEASPELVIELRERGVTAASFARLLHAAIPILTHERRLIACVNLDVAHTPIPDHLFYLADVSAEERATLGQECVGLDELPREKGVATPPAGLVLVWHRAIERLH